MPVDRQRRPRGAAADADPPDLDAPRLAKIIEQNNLYPALRARARPPRSSSACARTSASTSRTIASGATGSARSLVFTVGYTATDPAVAARRDQHAGLALRPRRTGGCASSRRSAPASSSRPSCARCATRLAGQEQKITAYKEQHLGELPEQREVNLRTHRAPAAAALDCPREQPPGQRAAPESSPRASTTSTWPARWRPAAAPAATAGPAGETAAAARLAILRNELAALQTTYSDKYPDVIRPRNRSACSRRGSATRKRSWRLAGRRGLAQDHRRPAANRRRT